MSFFSSVRKTIDYARRNGVGAAVTAARERIRDGREKYVYEEPTAEELQAQRAESRAWAEKGSAPLISIVVPCYQTPPEFLDELKASVDAQSYENHELILSEESGGISANTNAGIRRAAGEYVALLDHDDVLPPDALYHMVKAVLDARRDGTRPVLVYSDEDKFTQENKADGSRERRYFAPNRKPDYNYDYLLSNNYICHFTMVERQMLTELLLRPAFDGAQDHDLFLRVASETEREENGQVRQADRRFLPVPRVLYHWRVYGESTAESGANKSYAHDAGRRAVEEHLRGRGIRCRVEEMPHRGFFRVRYDGDIFAARPDIGAVGAKLTDRRGRMAGGLYAKDGTILFDGLPRGFSGGFNHRAVCAQDTPATDILGIRIRPEVLSDLPEEIRAFTKSREIGTMERQQRIDRSLALCREIRRRGYRILWDPAREVRVSDVTG